MLAGPFEGLLLPLAGVWGGQLARLSGAYEEEIADKIEQAISRKPALVVDAGAAEGYYAVGIARGLPRSHVIAFDIASEARRVCAATAKMNGVRNVEIRGRARPRELQRCLAPGALLLCDVEGYEQELLDPTIAPVLRSVDLIVELHEFARDGVTETFMSRFGASHSVELATAQPRVGQRPQLAHLDESTAVRAIQEGRPTVPPMQWAVGIHRQ